MKIKDMNAHQKAIYYIMDEVTRDHIGGNENILQDYPEDHPWYQEAKKFLSQGHDKLKQFFYDEVMGHTTRDSESAKHARFAGKEFLMERIEVRLTKWGY